MVWVDIPKIQNLGCRYPAGFATTQRFYIVKYHYIVSDMQEQSRLR